MQTIESYVVDLRTKRPSRFRLASALRIGVPAVAALALAAGLTWREAAPVAPAAPLAPKLAVRVIADPASDPMTDDDARVAAFQQSVAISHLTQGAPALALDEPPVEDAHPAPAVRQKPAKSAPKKVAMAFAPVPPQRPAPAASSPAPASAPAVAPAPQPAPPSMLMAWVDRVERAPGAVRDMTLGAAGRVIGAVGDVRSKAGF